LAAEGTFPALGTNALESKTINMESNAVGGVVQQKANGICKGMDFFLSTLVDVFTQHFRIYLSTAGKWLWKFGYHAYIYLRTKPKSAGQT
jgi:hypothetical protein